MLANEEDIRICYRAGLKKSQILENITGYQRQDSTGYWKASRLRKKLSLTTIE